MDLTQIRYYLALAETLNFTRAAASCNVTQPALTKSIRKLEDELGGPLLLRDRGRSQLTELGRTMLPLLQRTFDAATAARETASRFHGQDSARLRVGLGAWVPPDSLRPLLAALLQRFPRLELTVRQGKAAALNEWLLAAEIDVALTSDRSGLTAHANAWPLFADEVLTVMPPGHALDAGAVPAEALDRHAQVTRMDADAPVGGGEDTSPRHAAATEAHVWPLVQAGLGIALTTARRPAPPGLVRRELSPPCHVQVHLAAMPGRRPAPVTEALVRLARARDWGLTLSQGA